MKQDLTDAELDELDELLMRSPVPALNVLMLDGYLAGTLVQPHIVTPERWAPMVFALEEEGGLPPDMDEAWLARVTALMIRRRDAINAAISEDGGFDPLVVDVEREPPLSEYERVDEGEPLSDIARALMPWVIGFHWAMECFSRDDEDDEDESAGLLLARIYRHLPPETDDERAMITALDIELPLRNVDAAIEDLVQAVVELWDLTARQRFAVKTIQREHPKLGRNHPCFCGSGKKYKACHGG
jgi:uncharacterized protein